MLLLMHYSQLDRLTALWQILNPDSYVQPYPNHSGDFVKAPGTIEDIDTREWLIRNLPE